MTKIFCQWCEKEIPEIKDSLEVVLRGLLSSKDPAFTVSDPRSHEGRLYFFCSDECKATWMRKVLRRLQK